ncbi:MULTISPECIES: hypothetical protein [Streptomyces]|uniref:hypothetical protein n=1 Tax=Streptomyces TaxID=1883 RepID=UPI0011F34228|nr:MULTISPECIES: hypothetical protein [Streptomyces]
MCATQPSAPPTTAASPPRGRARTRPAPRPWPGRVLPFRSRLHRTGVRSFHRVESGLTGVSGPGVPGDNEAGVIGWGTSWRMQGYLLMAERTGDPAYARRLAELVDGVLAARDEVRGVADHRGVSGPVWSTAGKFTAATARIEDTDGNPALEVTVCPPRAVQAEVTVEPQGEGRFSLAVTGQGRAPFSVEGLALDPHDERRADRVVYAAHDQRTAVTARLVPAPDGAAGIREVRPGTYPVEPARVALAAQTGMITYPMAGLVRLARERPAAVPREVHARLEGCLDAVLRAVRAHEYQWTAVSGGRGCYRWLREEPVSFAGAELPTNEFLAVARTLVHLAVLTGDEEHAERAAAMARALRGDLRRVGGARGAGETGGGGLAGDVAVWPYWPGFGRVYNGWSPTGSPEGDGSLYRPLYAPVTVPEDVTHALIDLDFLHLYHRTPGLPPVFTRDDLRAVAATFTGHVVERHGRAWRMRHDVGGAGRPGTDRQQAHVAAWIPLREHNPRLPVLVSAIHPSPPPAPYQGVDSYCGALLARWS